MAEDSHNWFEGLNTRLSRRTVLRGGVIGGAGLAAAALIGCGDDDEEAPVATAAPTAPPTATPTRTPPPTAPAEVIGEFPRRSQSEIEQAVADMNKQAEIDGSPYPYAYLDPPGDPVEGGILKIGVTFSIGSWDISKSQAAGPPPSRPLPTTACSGSITGPGPASSGWIWSRSSRRRGRTPRTA